MLDVLLGHRNGHRTRSVDAAFELATDLVGATALEARTTFSLRATRTGADPWAPAVVLLGPADRPDGGQPERAGGGDRAYSTATPPAPGHGFALVSASPAPSPVEPSTGATDRVAVLAPGDEHGPWRLEAFGTSIEIEPVGIDRADLDAIVALVAHADRAAERVPAPAIGDEGQLRVRPHAIVVGLLGPVRVTDATGTPVAFERSKTTELVAWLVTHRAGASRGRARAALWELDVRDATFANVVSEARRGLARLVPTPDDDEWIGRTLTDRLPLHPLVVSDAELVAERLAYAEHLDPAAAVDVLRPAVELVRGMPFADTAYLWPDPEGIASELVLLATTAATRLAAHALDLGDIDLVFWASGRGLAVLPGQEELIGLRMRAHARSGDLAAVRQEWASYERSITVDSWADGEPAPKLLALRRELLRSG